MPSSHQSSKHGFTLTELTVVVLIVFVLGMVLFPVFARPHRGNRQASCASNQKQIALGFLQYVQDYDERYPLAVGYITLTADSGKQTTSQVFLQSWGSGRKLADGRYVQGILSPYIKSDQLFTDPIEPKSRDERFVQHYMYNDLVAGVRQSDVPAPAQSVLTTDAEDRLKNVGHALASDFNPHEANFNSKGRCDAGQGASIGRARIRHQGGANFAFTDGHLKWFKGVADDRVFFPPRESDSISAVDAKTKQQIGPKPGGDMVFQGRRYDATFHVK